MCYYVFRFVLRNDYYYYYLKSNPTTTTEFGKTLSADRMTCVYIYI